MHHKLEIAAKCQVCSATIYLFPIHTPHNVCIQNHLQKAKRQTQWGLAIAAGTVAVTHCMQPLQSPHMVSQPLVCSLPNSQHFVINQLLWGVYLILQLFCS